MITIYTKDLQMHRFIHPYPNTSATPVFEIVLQLLKYFLTASPQTAALL